MKVLSLFDGISCGRVALERAGIPVEAYYASEIDKYAIQIAQKNYPDTMQLGDIKEIDCTGGKLHYGTGRLAETDIDLVCGGSPCQDLSIAKKNREGLDGKRSGLFWEYVRILKELKPKYFVLENVASMSKEARATITETLWGIEPVMINAALVSAQNRKRLFFCGQIRERLYFNDVLYENKGILGKTQSIMSEMQFNEARQNNGRVFDIYQLEISQPEDRGILLKDVLENYVGDEYVINPKMMNYKGSNQKSVTITSSSYKEPPKVIRLGQFNSGGQRDRIYSPEGKLVGLSALGGGRGAKTGLYIVQTPRGKNAGGKRALNGKVPTLSSSSWEHNNKLSENEVIRKLTPVECERLMTLPAIEKSCIIRVCSDHQNNSAVVVDKNPKSQLSAGSVEKNGLKEPVLFVGENLNIKNLQTEKLAQSDVVISCSENSIELYNQDKLLLNVNGAELKNLHPHLKSIDDFVHLLVGLNTIVEKTVPFGKAGLPQKSSLLVVKENGNNVVSLYGKGITQLAEDAGKDLTILKKLLTSTTSDLFGQENKEQLILTLFSFVVSAIIGYIPKEIQNQNILTFQIKSKVGYTWGVSTSQRYKMLGNGFVVDVVAHILKHINYQNGVKSEQF